jgi:protein-S-isoprenylcysteine O-methyltransferase Ste14
MSGVDVKAWLGLVALAVVMAALLFGTAGTLHYWQAWLFLAVFLGASALITLYLMRHDPALLRRRLVGGPTAEKEPAQKIIVLLASIGFIALMAVPALGRRFGWAQAPLAVVILGDVLIAIGFFIVFLAFRQNSFTSSRIEIAADQHVVSTGPYAVVRHPQYAGSLVYLLGMPLALGSWWGLLVLVPMTPVLIWRLFDEEALLTRQLPGYADYRRGLRWRLIPGVF